MKVRDTSRGRMYAVSSAIGCTAINGAMAIDIPAGGQSVILALDKKIVIDGDDAAKFVEVRWGTNTAVGSRPVPSWLSDVLSGLVSIVGEANFDINYIPAENKLYLQFSPEVTTEQIEEVRSLLGRVLPSNVVTEIDEMPITYTRLEYLESTGTQYINTGVNIDNDSEVNCTFESRTTEYIQHEAIFGTRTEYANGITLFYPADSINKGILVFTSIFGVPAEFGKKTLAKLNKTELKCGAQQFNNNGSISGEITNMLLFCVNVRGYSLVTSPYYYAKARVYSFSISRNNQLQLNFIPCLDNTGTPCMFDTVSRTPFRNIGDGDFIIGIETQQQLDNMLNSFPNYTGQAIEKLQINLAEVLQTPENEARLAEAMAQNSTMPAMLSLDGDFVAPRFYAQLTEHGIRRLYHVPKGYIGTMDEYAAVNGFKELVEPPMPMIGYWVPEWRETDTQLICEWVETEPPVEEETPIEEIENA